MALKTAKTCIGQIDCSTPTVFATIWMMLTPQVGLDQLELGLKILESAAAREESLSKSGDEDQADLIVRLSSEYYLLRISLVRPIKPS